MNLTNLKEEQRPGNTGLAKVAVQCSADTFVVNQTLVLRINICGEIRHFAKPQNVSGHCKRRQCNNKDSE